MRHGLHAQVGQTVDHQIGLRIKRHPRVMDMAQGLAGIWGAQQGTRRLVPHPLPQQIKVGAQPDRHARLMDHLAVGFGQKGAAAGRQHTGLAAQQPGQDFAFAGAEKGLAVALEDLGDAAVGGVGDLFIRIKKVHRQQPRKRRSHSRLARPHHPHHHHGLFQPLHSAFSGPIAARGPALTTIFGTGPLATATFFPEWREVAANAIYIRMGWHHAVRAHYG